MSLQEEVEHFALAARWVAGLVRELPADAQSEVWSGPGLGDWDLRALVGHTSRALLTVEQYLERPAESEQAASAAEYYEQTGGAGAADAGAVLQRGIDAGAALGDDPAAAFAGIVERVIDRLASAEDGLILTIVGGMRLSSYLPTRTFELVVHGLDIATAADLPPTPPESALSRTLELATALAIRSGQGSRVLLALTGRRGLGDGFTVLT